MKKLLFLSFLLFNAVDGAREVHLDLRTEVDSVLNIERIDDGGAIDIFSKQGANYRVVYNGDQRVRVNFRSKNGWKLKSSDSEIPYQGEVRTNSSEEVVDEQKDSMEIDSSEFSDSQCEFEVIFSSKMPIGECKAGRYSDRMTISVEAI